MAIKIVTPDWGVLEIDESTVITFPDGMPGFEHCKRFKLLFQERDNATPRVLWMQSLDEPDLMFSVIDAALLGIAYRLELSDDDLAKLEASKPEDYVLLLILSKQGAEGKVMPNVNSPIVLNTASRKALQKGGMRGEIIFE